MLETFQYIKYTVISSEPEDDAIYKIKQISKSLGIETPKIIGWDFSHLSQEQINVYHMHGYTAAVVISDDLIINKCSIPVETVEKQNYVTMTIKNQMDNPFSLISNAYKAVFQYINVNRYKYNHFAFEHQFIKEGINYMKIYVAIQ